MSVMSGVLKVNFYFAVFLFAADMMNKLDNLCAYVRLLIATVFNSWSLHMIP